MPVERSYKIFMPVEVLQFLLLCRIDLVTPSLPARGLMASGSPVYSDWQWSPSHRVCLGSKAITRELEIASLRSYEHGVLTLRSCGYQIVDARSSSIS